MPSHLTPIRPFIGESQDAATSPPELLSAPSSLSNILLRAASIISSLLLRNVSCRDSLLLVHPPAPPVDPDADATGGRSALSFPFTLAATRDCRLYRVIRSISVLVGFGVPVAPEVVEGEANVMGGWKDGGACCLCVSYEFSIILYPDHADTRIPVPRCSILYVPDPAPSPPVSSPSSPPHSPYSYADPT